MDTTHARLLLLVLLAIELSLCYQMCDPYSKFEEDRTKTAGAIVDDRYFGQTDRQTYIHSTDLYLSSAMPCIAQTISHIIIIRLTLRFCYLILLISISTVPAAIVTIHFYAIHNESEHRQNKSYLTFSMQHFS